MQTGTTGRRTKALGRRAASSRNSTFASEELNNKKKEDSSAEDAAAGSSSQDSPKKLNKRKVRKGLKGLLCNVILFKYNLLVCFSHLKSFAAIAVMNLLVVFLDWIVNYCTLQCQPFFILILSSKTGKGKTGITFTDFPQPNKICIPVLNRHHFKSQFHRMCSSIFFGFILLLMIIELLETAFWCEDHVDYLKERMVPINLLRKFLEKKYFY